MPLFCDVALPVPLDMAFTYRIAERPPLVGARVLVPFRNERLSGVVTALHDRQPSMTAKPVLEVLDAEPALDATLMKLGEWIAHYYLAPLGEVLRTMLPLAAEFKKAKVYSITEVGHEALHASATAGSSRRSRLDVADERQSEHVVAAVALDLRVRIQKGIGERLHAHRKVDQLRRGRGGQTAVAEPQRFR